MGHWTQVFVTQAEIMDFVPVVRAAVQIGGFEMRVHAFVLAIEATNLYVLRHFNHRFRFGIHIKAAIRTITCAQLFGRHRDAAIGAIAQKHRTRRWTNENAAIGQVIRQHLVAVVQQLHFAICQTRQIECLPINVPTFLGQKFIFSIGKGVVGGKHVLSVIPFLVETFAVGGSVLECLLDNSGGWHGRVCGGRSLFHNCGGSWGG